MAQTLNPTRARSPSEREEVRIAAADHRIAVGARRSAATRARILAAAAEVISRKGVEQPVIDDFVRAADISRGTFYNYFSTTAELLEATVDWLREDMNRAIVRVVATMDDPVRQSATAMRLYLRWATSSPTLCACVARLPEMSASAWEQARKEMAAGVARGEFIVPSIEVGCDLAFGTLGESIRRTARDPGKPLACDDVVAVILAGLGVRPKRVREVLAMPLPQVLVAA